MIPHNLLLQLLCCITCMYFNKRLVLLSLQYSFFPFQQLLLSWLLNAVKTLPGAPCFYEKFVSSIEILDAFEEYYYFLRIPLREPLINDNGTQDFVVKLKIILCCIHNEQTLDDGLWCGFVLFVKRICFRIFAFLKRHLQSCNLISKVR